MHALLLASSALFAWSMGSHYTGSVAGALLLTAALTVVGSVGGSVNVVGTYTRIVAHPSTVDLTARCAELSRMRVVETKLYAHPYARLSSSKATDVDLGR